MTKTNPPKQFFTTRRQPQKPAGAPETLIPILTAFLTTILCAITTITFPTAPSNPTKNYLHITYEYHLPQGFIYSTTAHSKKSINGIITSESTNFTLDKTPPEPDCKIDKCLTLTFDDGPSAHTDRLLDMLSRTHAKATFFVLGNRAQSFSGQIVRMAQEGHDISSHSWAHRNLPRFPYATILGDLSDTTNAIQSITSQPVKFLRPPYGSINNNVNTAAAALNQQIVLWSVDPQDWRYRDANYVCDHIVNHVVPGSVVLLHDIYSTSIDAAECAINRLSSSYSFVNLSTLYK